MSSTAMFVKSRVGISLLVLGWLTAGFGQAIGPWVPLFKGIEHSVSTHEAGAGPLKGLQVVNALRVDLEDPDIRLMTTPRYENYVEAESEAGAYTVSDFLRNHRLQVAVNGNRFGEREYYLAPNTPVNIGGLSINQGIVVSSQDSPEDTATFYFDSSNRAGFWPTNWPAKGNEGIETAISGTYPIVVSGTNVGRLYTRLGGHIHNANPRTLMGLTQDRKRLLIATIDGRQPGYSVGADDEDGGEWMLALGAYDAINLDGGGSTTLVYENNLGEADRLNRSSAVADSGKERTVGSHFGIFARPVPGFVNEIVASGAVNSAQIQWSTVKRAKSRVAYGLSTNLGTVLEASTEAAVIHSLRLDGLTPDTRYFFQIVASDSEGDHFSPIRAFVTTNRFTLRTLISMDQTWRYAKPEEVDGKNWWETGFDDSKWSGPGKGPLGIRIRAGNPGIAYETGLEVNPGTLLPYISYFFRTQFDLTSIPSGSSLLLSNYIDDGAVFYLNGKELTRVRMPDGEVDSTTLATGFPCEGDATCPDVLVVPLDLNTGLVAGRNVLAAEVHNYNRGSGDIIFGTSVFLRVQEPESLLLEWRESDQGLLLKWSGAAVLQESSSPGGPWSDVNTGTKNVHPLLKAGRSQVFYRLSGSR